MLNFSKHFQLILSRTFITSIQRTSQDINKIKKSILISHPNNNDFMDIVKFVSKEYIPNEPTLKALGITSSPIMQDRVLLALSHGISLVAKCKNTGKIMGVAINERTNPWDADLVDRMAECVQCEKLKKALHFYAFLGKAPSVYNEYKVNEVFEIANLGVAQDERNLGIATKLVEESKKVAMVKNFHILRVDATSFYTARICEKLNMKLIYEIPYDSYLDANKKPVFEIAYPHTGAKVYILQLGKRKNFHTVKEK